MSLRTSNACGSIIITDEVVASVAGHLASDCYGVIELVPRNLSDTFADLFRKNNEKRGVRVTSKGDRVYLDLFVVLRYGLSIDAVATSLKSTVKYGVEKFTGMLVQTVNVHVMGVQL